MSAGRFLLVAAMVILLGRACCATTYATWLMIWYGSDQAWWKAGNTDASRVLLDGRWTTLNWTDTSQTGAILDGLKEAGVSVVIADLTNGWKWLDARSQFIQSLCAKKGLKFCVAENSTGNTASFESHAQDIWNNFAGPDAPYRDTYFRYRGKPLIVCYAIRDWYKAYLTMTTPYRSRFSLVWASGEDSSINKWGWQLEPWVGVVPSDDSMFVTSAVRWNPADPTMWRKSLAWLDYNFALAKKANPAYVVIGSYDDPTERNTWIVCDTSRCEPGRQIRDRTGALNPYSHYERVKQWIKGNPAVVPGGCVRDGAYRIASAATGRRLGVANSDKISHGAPGAALTGTGPRKAPIGLFWLYHLGANHYRIIPVHSGLAIEPADNNRVIQSWESGDLRQRWTLVRSKTGFRVRSDSAGTILSMDGDAVTLKPASSAFTQDWRFEPVLTL